MTAPAPEAFHTVVVGAGSGGLTVAVGMSRLGKRVALVEAADVGGDCTNVGCIPSKTLIELARRGTDATADATADACTDATAEATAEATADATATDRAALARAALAETRRQRDDLREHEEDWLAGLPNMTLVRGHARLAPGANRTPDVLVRSPDGVERRLQARNVVLATGSRPLVPALPGLDATEPSVLTNATLFDLDAPPAHLLVLGAGAIGCEMAFAFVRLGSRVSLVELAERVLPASESEASAVVHARLTALGVRVHTSTGLTRFDPDARRATLASAGAPAGVNGRDGDGDGDGASDAASASTTLDDVDRVLVAVGRRPASDDLDLEQVGVKVDARGAVLVDGAYRTGVPGVFAIGDLVGGAFTHVAHAQGRRLVRFLTLPLPLWPEGEHSAVAFTEPEVGQVGPTLATLRQRWPDALLWVHRVELATTDRGRTTGLRDGFVQLVALRGSGRLLAATVVAPEASEMLPLLTWAQRRRVSLWQLSRLEVAYPALSEAVRQAADAFLFESLPRLQREIGIYLRWRWRRPKRS